MLLAFGTAGVLTVGCVALTQMSESDGGSRDRPSENPRMLAAWACSNLEQGSSEAAVTQALTAEASGRGVDLQATLREVIRQCPDLLE